MTQNGGRVILCEFFVFGPNIAWNSLNCGLFSLHQNRIDDWFLETALVANFLARMRRVSYNMNTAIWKVVHPTICNLLHCMSDIAQEAQTLMFVHIYRRRPASNVKTKMLNECTVYVETLRYLKCDSWRIQWDGNAVQYTVFVWNAWTLNSVWWGYCDSAAREIERSVSSLHSFGPQVNSINKTPIYLHFILL